MFIGPRTTIKARLIFLAVVLPLVLLGWGLAEIWTCARVLIGPTTVTYAEASQTGLARFGYVRVTGIEFDTEHATAIVHMNPDTRQPGPWEGVYMPVAPWPDPSVAGGLRVLAFFPDARTAEDLEAYEESEELTGFVEGPFNRINPGHRSIVKSLAGADGAKCWVISVKHPSWLKGLGLLLGSTTIPGGVVLWCMRRPLPLD